MKTNTFKFQLKAFAFMFLAVLFAACQDDSMDDVDKTPTFPEATTLSISKPGESAIIQFDANYPWTLSTSRTWCKFVDAGEELSSFQGIAGAHTVEILITDDAWVFEDQTAVITMGMTTDEGTVTQEIVTLVRSSKEYSQSVYGATEEDMLGAENPLQMIWYAHGGAIQTSVLNFSANYNWEITSMPEWLVLDADLNGSADELTTYECSFNTTAEQRNALEGEIVFSDENGTARFTLPVAYNGYPETKVGFEIPSAAGMKFNYWYDVSGTAYWYAANDGQQMGQTEGAVYIKVKANETQELHVLTYAQDAAGNLSVLAAEDRWFSVTEPTAENEYTISIQPTENTEAEERGVRFVVLTESVFNDETINGDPANLIEYNETLGITITKEAYANYAALAFTQEAPIVETGSVFGVANAFRNASWVYEQGEALEVFALTGDDLEATYGTTNVYAHIVDLSALTNERLWITSQSSLYDAAINGDVSFNDKDGNNTRWSTTTTNFSDPALVLKVTATQATPMQIRCTFEGEEYVLLIAQEGTLEGPAPVFGVANAFRNASYLYEAGDALTVTASSESDLEATYGTTNVFECTFNKTSDLTHERLWVTADFDLNAAFQNGSVSYNDKDGNSTATAGGWSISPSFSYEPAAVLKITTPGTSPLQIRCTVDGVVYVLVLKHV